MPFGRMVRFAGGTPPVMVATCFFFQNFSAVAFGTEGIAAPAGNRFRNHIYAVTVGAMPARGTVSSGSKNSVAIGTMPVFCTTSSIIRMSRSAIGAVPYIGTGITNLQNDFMLRAIPVLSAGNKICRMMHAATFVIPEMCAVFGFHEDFTAFGTVQTTFRTDCIQRMTRFAFGTVPKMIARLTNLVSPLTIFIRTIPLTAANDIRRMMRLIRFAIPEMYAIFGLAENFIAFGAKQFSAGTVGV